MIVTFTANPSLDRTVLLSAPLDPEGINHVVAASTIPGGRGVHVTAVVRRAGRPSLAILPMKPRGHLADVLHEAGIPTRIVPVGHNERVNITLSHEGSTTVLREPGQMLGPETVTAMMSAVMAGCPGASWLALCGSLPPGAPVDLYVRMARVARGVGVRVAVQATGPGLEAVLAHSPRDAPDLLVLNARQFSRATGADLTDCRGEDRVVTAARHVDDLLHHGVPRLLVTLGEDGAISADASGVWYARSQPVSVATAIGRGAAALAGYLMAHNDGEAEPDRLARAVAYGTARTGLPGSEAPSPADADAVAVLVSELPHR